MYEFYEDLNECIEEGLRTVKEVKNIKGDSRKCLDILTKSCEQSKKNQRTLIEAITLDPEFKKAVVKNKTFSSDENLVLKDFKMNSSHKEQFAQKYYKNCSPKDVDKITIYEVTSVDEDPNMVFAKVVFGDNEMRIHKINYVIEHFDELLPEKCKRNKIPAMYLYFFYERCKPKLGGESFLKYFNKYYKDHGGRWEPIGKTALTGARSKNTLCKDDSTKKLKDEMLRQIESMFN